MKRFFNRTLIVSLLGASLLLGGMGISASAADKPAKRGKGMVDLMKELDEVQKMYRDQLAADVGQLTTESAVAKQKIQQARATLKLLMEQEAAQRKQIILMQSKDGPLVEARTRLKQIEALSVDWAKKTETASPELGTLNASAQRELDLAQKRLADLEASLKKVEQGLETVEREHQANEAMIPQLEREAGELDAGVGQLTTEMSELDAGKLHPDLAKELADQVDNFVDQVRDNEMFTRLVAIDVENLKQKGAITDQRIELVESRLFPKLDRTFLKSAVIDKAICNAKSECTK